MARITAGLDSCIFIEAANDPRGLAHVILAAFEADAFDVLVASKTVLEVERNLRTPLGKAYFERCRKKWLVCNPPPPEAVESETMALLAIMRHAEDVPIALAMRYSQIRPTVFVTSNTGHWKPSLLNSVLGCEVLDPKGFLRYIGVPRPPRKP